MINDEIEVTIVELKGKSVKLGFTYPPESTILRRELYDKIQAENKQAAQGVALLKDRLDD